MWMRIVSGTVSPGSWDQYEKLYREIVVNEGPLPGLRGRWLIRNGADGDSGSSISLWESEEAMRTYESSALLREKLSPPLEVLWAGGMQKTCYEVRVAERFDAETFD